MPPIQASAAKGHVFADGTWDGSFHPDFEPHPDEAVAQEHWLSSGFANTDLDLQLKKQGLRAVTVMGMRANTCIESTVRFAAEFGYEGTVVKDAIGSFGHAESAASLQFNMPAYASAVVSTDEIVATLSEASDISVAEQSLLFIESRRPSTPRSHASARGTSSTTNSRRRPCSSTCSIAAIEPPRFGRKLVLARWVLHLSTMSQRLKPSFPMEV